MYQKAEYNGLPLADIFVCGGPACPAGYPAARAVHAARTHAAQLRAAPVLRYRRRRLRPLVARDARHPYDTGVGQVVSSTSYFDRRVEETEDQTDFIYDLFRCQPDHESGLTAAGPDHRDQGLPAVRAGDPLRV
jgi:hypothetical protein